MVVPLGGKDLSVCWMGAGWVATMRTSRRARKLFSSGPLWWLRRLDLNQRPLGYEPFPVGHQAQCATNNPPKISASDRSRRFFRFGPIGLGARRPRGGKAEGAGEGPGPGAGA